MYVMYVYKATSRFTSARKYKLIKFIAFIWVFTFILVSWCYTKLVSATFCRRYNASFQYTFKSAASQRELERLSLSIVGKNGFFVNIMVW